MPFAEHGPSKLLSLGVIGVLVGTPVPLAAGGRRRCCRCRCRADE